MSNYIISPLEVHLPVFHIPSPTFTREAFDFNIDIKKSYNEAFKILYKNSVNESNNTFGIINESIISDFVDSIGRIIEKVKKFIVGIIKSFSAMIMSKIRSDKIIIDNKDTIMQFKDLDNNFIKRNDSYTYTFNQDIPMNRALLYNFAPEKIEEIDVTDIDSISSTIKSLEYENRNRFYDKARADICGNSGELITSDDYKDYVFAMYRDGKLKPSDITITREVVLKELAFFESALTEIAKLESDKKDILKTYDDIKKTLSRTLKLKSALTDDIKQVSFNGQNIELNSESYNGLNSIINIYSKRFIELSNIHNLAFSMKLDALKNAYDQSKDICFMALKEANRQSMVGDDE